MPQNSAGGLNVSSSGGKALGLGVWYQTTGAIAGALTDWEFGADPIDLNLSAAGLTGVASTTFLVEYFDMDATQLTGGGVAFVQFKATSQESLPEFDKEEARKIIKSATRAYLAHLKHSDVLLKRFILATNRHEGKPLKDLRERRSALDSNLTDEQALQWFGSQPAIDDLWEGQAGKTMRDLAISLLGFAKDTPSTVREQQTNACLTVMLRYTFAAAKPAKIREKIEGWLREWGFLANEFDSVAQDLVGKLIAKGGDAQRLTPDSLMQEHLGSPLAVRLTFDQLSPTAAKNLAGEFDREPPTPHGVTPVAFASWMVLRRDARGQVADALSKPDSHYRIVALVGNGGTGKTTLMHQGMRSLMGLDPEGNATDPLPNGWGPYLSIKLSRTVPTAEAVKSEIDALSGHRHSMGEAEARLATANGKGQGGCALCLAIDGLDEIEEVMLQSMLDGIAAYVRSRESVRIILTCRDAQRDPLMRHPTLGRLTDVVRVGNLNEKDALRQFNAMMGFDYLAPTESADALAVSSRLSMANVQANIDPAIYLAVQHPLMFGSLKTFSDEGGKAEIERACNSDIDGLNVVAQRFVGDLCVRISYRLHHSEATPPAVFSALQALAINVADVALAQRDDWELACDYNPGLGANGERLRSQCISSGFIDPENSRFRFRWRHPFIGSALRTMEEPRWP